MVRFADRAVKDRATKWIRGGEKRSVDDEDVGTKTPVESKGETRQKKLESWTKLVRAYKRKASSRETIRSLWEMTELPEELREAAREAKRAIREAERSSEARTRARKLAKRGSLKRRLVRVYSVREFFPESANLIYVSFHFRSDASKVSCLRLCSIRYSFSLSFT